MIEMNDDLKLLFDTILKLKTEEDCAELFDDLCTYTEIEAMTQRIKAAKLLTENKTYEEIIRETDISSATLSRVSRCVKFGKGYKKFLET
ncbi:MAG: TrpR-related protein YerC/YecD [Clostridia bacterium]|nr:TrpR-related protein YerC/YecD [Clostridia bacterium]